MKRRADRCTPALALALASAVGLGASACSAEPPPAPPDEAAATDTEPPPPVEPLPEALDHRVQTHVAQFGRNWPAFHLHGAVLVARGDEVGVDRAFGQSHLVDGRDNTTTTRFRIGTLSAPITAVVILRLVEDGKLSLHDPIDAHVPEMLRADGITVEHLLSHRSGLPSFSDTISFQRWKRQAHEPTETMALVAGVAPEIEPGSEVWPSNTNYLLLGIIAERVAHRSFAELARDLVLTPAKMTATTYGDPDTGDAAVGMQFNDDEALDVVTDVEPLAFGAAGAFVSTTGDLHRLMVALTDDTLLTEASRDRLFGRTPEDPGYGFVPDVRFGRRVLQWPGLIDGFNGALVHYPADATTVIVLANSEVVPTALLAEEIAAMAYGAEGATWSEARPAPIPIADQLAIVGQYGMTIASAEELAAVADPDQLLELSRVSVQRVGDHLVLDVPGHARRRMHPLSARQYFFKDVSGTTAEAAVRPDGSRKLVLRQRTGQKIVYVTATGA